MLVFTEHAERRRKERGMTEIDIELVVKQPFLQKRRQDGLIEVICKARNRNIKVVYEKRETHLRIITVI